MATVSAAVSSEWSRGRQPDIRHCFLIGGISTSVPILNNEAPRRADPQMPAEPRAFPVHPLSGLGSHPGQGGNQTAAASVTMRRSCGHVAELDDRTGGGREQVSSPPADVHARVELGATLADQDLARADLLRPAKRLTPSRWALESRPLRELDAPRLTYVPCQSSWEESVGLGVRLPCHGQTTAAPVGVSGCR